MIVFILVVAQCAKTNMRGKLLQKKTALFYSEDTSGQHLGLGLAVSRVLCQKHGGTIELSNQPPHRACVKASIKIEQPSL